MSTVNNNMHLYAMGYVHPDSNSYTNKIHAASKIFGYLPVIGTFVGLARIATALKNHQDGKLTARHITRGLVECSSLGCILIIPDIVVSVFRSAKKDIEKLNEYQNNLKASLTQLDEVLDEMRRCDNDIEDSIQSLERIKNELQSLEAPSNESLDEQIQRKLHFNEKIREINFNINIALRKLEKINLNNYSRELLVIMNKISFARFSFTNLQIDIYNN